MTAVQSCSTTEAMAKNATRNYLSSALYMKRATNVCLSTLTYLRGIFPEDAYRNENFLGMNITILKDNPKSAAAKFFSDIIKGIFDAFDKKYLRRLVLSIYEDQKDPNSLIEFYLFNYNYNENDAGVVLQSGTPQRIMSSLKIVETGAILQATKNLLRTCVVMTSGSDILPPQYDLSIQLYYYDDVTPPDYEPKGFVPLQNDTLANRISDERYTTMGRISTNYHKLRVQKYQRPNNDNETNVEDSPIIDRVEEKELTKSDEQINQYESTDVQASAPATHSEPMIATMQMRCPCNQVSGFEHNIIMCRYCEKWQHSVCFGILPNQTKQIEEHCCEECALANPEMKCSCEKIVHIEDPVKRARYCLLRRALILCMQHRAMNALMLRDIMEVDTKTSLQMMRRLVKFEVFEPIKAGEETNPLNKRVVNMTKLKQHILHAFQNNEAQTEEDSVEVIGKMIERMDTHSNTGEATQCESIAAFREILSQENLSQRHHPSDIMDCVDLPIMQPTGRNLRPRKRQQENIEKCPPAKKEKVSMYNIPRNKF